MNTSMFRGVTVALITPFDQNGQIDEPALRKLVERQIVEGTDVILSCGTTGESATLSEEEQVRVTEIIIDQVNKRVPVMCGAGTNDTRTAIDLTRRAEAIGADGILSVAPYYNKPTQEGFYQHFKAIAEATKLPVILYNVPGRTGSNISAETTVRLAAIDNITGIKEASGNLSQIMDIIKYRPKYGPESFLMLSGDDSLTLAIIALGGDGIVSVVANEVPGLFKEMVWSALNNNWAKARELHYKLLPLMNINFIESNPIPVKAALAMMGLLQENYRLPLVKMSDKNRAQLQTVLKILDLI